MGLACDLPLLPRAGQACAWAFEDLPLRFCAFCSWQALPLELTELEVNWLCCVVC